jgi:uncharacterized protein with GYD domain
MRSAERRREMATYLGLLRFTDQGIRNVKQTTKRAKDFQEFAAKMNVKVKEMYWTLGRYDVVVVGEAPDDGSITRLTLGLGMLGNVKSETLRAFSAQEMDKILMGLP